MKKISLGEVKYGFFDLLHLNGTIDEKTDVVHDESNDLNGVFHAQGIPHEEKLIQEAENIEG